ncbi:gluconokinase [Jannaschia sp. S6380]|uniref:gluconokinase n=1 Tax=Jannaschia sp. S6380 TaxID=2926408 RepID=UPI001FF61196|nr:gluconokinase [Jannaschia sp. S6380]MCK0167097.1 gluconokinase [Jannaschia sp. S6380]
MGTKIVVMGVTSTGKTLMGSKLAEALHGRFIDGDDLHPQANVDKMARGEPLDDRDRAPWLDRIGRALAGGEGTMVVACSALKRAYRDRIRDAAGPVVFVHLTGPRELIAKRMTRREGHFMPVSLLESQLATLEPPGPGERSIELDIERPPAELLRLAVDRLRARPAD